MALLEADPLPSPLMWLLAGLNSTRAIGLRVSVAQWL